MLLQVGTLVIAQGSGAGELLAQVAAHFLGHLRMPAKEPQRCLAENRFIGGESRQQLHGGDFCAGHLIQCNERGALGVGILAGQTGGSCLRVANLDERVNERMLQHTAVVRMRGGEQCRHGGSIANAPQCRGSLAANGMTRGL